MIFKKYIQFFKEEDWKSLKEFIKKYTHERYILSDKKYFDWQFMPPNKEIKTPSVLILKNRGSILGYLGLISLKMNYFGEEIKGTCLANLMTDSSLRNKGAGVDFIEKAQEEGGDVVYTTGYIPPVDSIYEHFEWKKEILLRRFILIINKGKVINLIGKNTVLFVPALEELPTESEYIFEEKQILGDEINDLWNKVKYKYPITIMRDEEYLNWRYTQNPFLKYHIFIGKKNNQIESFIVVRIEKTAKYTIGRIIDFMATDDAETHTLLNAVEFCKKQKVYLIDFFFTGNFHVTSLKQLGFMEGDTEPYSLIPIRFNPIDKRIMTINFTFKFMNKKMMQDLQSNNVNNWYITKGDGDQDRLNSH